MAHTAAYTGLRWGELAALTAPQAGTGARIITIDHKIIEIGGQSILAQCGVEMSRSLR